tara:strand:- start:2245 stop:2706 length:462 start_codon:yes stop_codon:yes gene_type:complete
MPKDEIVKGTNKIARVKPIKNLGKNKEGELIQAQTVKINEKIGKVTDKSKTVNRYKDGKLVSSDYIPNKLKPKRIKKLKTTKVPRKLKKVPVPSYTAPSVTLDEEDKKEIAKRERIANAKKKKKKLKIKLPKFRRPKRRKTKNLVTGKYNYTQ